MQGMQCEMVRDLDRSLGSRYLLKVANKRTCFASYVCAFKRSRLIICLECTSSSRVIILKKFKVFQMMDFTAWLSE